MTFVADEIVTINDVHHRHRSMLYIRPVADENGRHR